MRADFLQIGNVVRGGPSLPATSADVKYWFMTMGKCAGASRDMRSTWLNMHAGVRMHTHTETIIKICTNKKVMPF